ncbi:hypothetical protein SELMODRAFT_79549 [Selaginella moellendorffii]|uniref:Phosphatidic acid phosphatase type 2/haloperoxidase domain-containing protein n=1 Tax=Selaginella moellendorffii TaxID=88036 RepID=D8QWV9_SELML|nr:hypothetical protein SELMODRAFT_79549 [Selaginella moellendorffii]
MSDRTLRWRHCLLRHHAHDWAILIALAIFELLLLKVIHPFRRYMNEYMINDLRFPVKSFTVPIAALVVISFAIPLLFILGYYVFKRNTRDLHHAILGLFFTVIITSVITDSLKNLTGRPRPDFFWRCFPDGVPHFKPISGDVACTGSAGEVRQGYKSFPSGHASWSFAGLGYLSWYLAGRIKFAGHRGRIIKFVIAALPLVGATLVAISIMNDYWHHWSDVVAGAVIGTNLCSSILPKFLTAVALSQVWSLGRCATGSNSR